MNLKSLHFLFDYILCSVPTFGSGVLGSYIYLYLCLHYSHGQQCTTVLGERISSQKPGRIERNDRLLVSRIEQTLLKEVNVFQFSI